MRRLIALVSAFSAPITPAWGATLDWSPTDLSDPSQIYQPFSELMYAWRYGYQNAPGPQPPDWMGYILAMMIFAGLTLGISSLLPRPRRPRSRKTAQERQAASAISWMR